MKVVQRKIRVRYENEGKSSVYMVKEDKVTRSQEEYRKIRGEMHEGNR